MMSKKANQMEQVSKVCPHRNKSPMRVVRGYKLSLFLFLKRPLGILPFHDEITLQL
jgi:hypothetical protein